MPEKKCPLKQINVFRLTSLYISLFSFSTIRCVILINDKVNLLCVIDHKYMSILQNISIVKPVPPDLLVCLYSVDFIYSFFLCLYGYSSERASSGTHISCEEKDFKNSLFKVYFRNKYQLNRDA